MGTGSVLTSIMVSSLNRAGKPPLVAYKAIFLLYAVAAAVKIVLSLALSAHSELDHPPVPPKTTSTASTASAEGDGERQPLLQHQTASSTASAVLDPPQELPPTPTPLPIARLVVLCAIFSLDAFASSLGPGSFIAYFLRETFSAPVALIASIFSVASVTTCVSQLAAGSISKRLGVVKTMVATHVRARGLSLSTRRLWVHRLTLGIPTDPCAALHDRPRARSDAAPRPDLPPRSGMHRFDGRVGTRCVSRRPRPLIAIAREEEEDSTLTQEHCLAQAPSSPRSSRDRPAPSSSASLTSVRRSLRPRDRLSPSASPAWATFASRSSSWAASRSSVSRLGLDDASHPMHPQAVRDSGCARRPRVMHDTGPPRRLADASRLVPLPPRNRRRGAPPSLQQLAFRALNQRHGKRRSLPRPDVRTSTERDGRRLKTPTGEPGRTNPPFIGLLPIPATTPLFLRFKSVDASALRPGGPVQPSPFRASSCARRPRLLCFVPPLFFSRPLPPWLCLSALPPQTTPAGSPTRPWSPSSADCCGRSSVGRLWPVRTRRGTWRCSLPAGSYAWSGTSLPSSLSEHPQS